MQFSYQAGCQHTKALPFHFCSNQTLSSMPPYCDCYHTYIIPFVGRKKTKIILTLTIILPTTFLVQSGFKSSNRDTLQMSSMFTHLCRLCYLSIPFWWESGYPYGNWLVLQVGSMSLNQWTANRQVLPLDVKLCLFLQKFLKFSRFYLFIKSITLLPHIRIYHTLHDVSLMLQLLTTFNRDKKQH